VEYDASNRALAWIQSRGIVNSSEHSMAKDALDAAAKTYLVAAIGALASLLFWVLMFLGVNRD
jgi:Zn-dependent membrane protease YugP